MRSDPNARLIVANSNAMEAAIALSFDLGEAAVIAIQEAFLANTHPEYAALWLAQQV